MPADGIEYLVCGPNSVDHRRDGLGEIIARERTLADGEFIWITLAEPDHATLGPIGSWLSLHPLMVKDAVGTHRRARIDHYGDTAFTVLKTVWYLGSQRRVYTGEVAVIRAGRVVMSVRHGQYDPVPAAIENLTEHPKLRACGTAAVPYVVFSRVVDEYLDSADAVAEELNDLERSVFSGERVSMVEEIYSLNRQVLEFHDAVQPLNSIAADEILDGSGPVTNLGPYRRDLAHRIKRVTNSVDNSTNLLSSILDSHLGQISMWQNEDMRKMSAWAALVGVPAVVSGFYGMNFTHMPELDWWFAYPLAVALIVILCLLLYRGFRRNGWL